MLDELDVLDELVIIGLGIKGKDLRERDCG